MTDDEKRVRAEKKVRALAQVLGMTVKEDILPAGWFKDYPVIIEYRTSIGATNMSGFKTWADALAELIQFKFK